MENGQFLLKLIDAKLDKDRNELLTVFEFYEDTLHSFLKQRPEIRLFDKEINIRKEFWSNIQSIVKGITINQVFRHQL